VERVEIGLPKAALKQKVHMGSVIKSQNLNKDGIVRILTETHEDCKFRVEITECKEPNANLVNVLIDNVILAIKINTSMLSMQDHSLSFGYVYINSLKLVQQELCL
jgi:hypothetical protein